MITEPEQRCCRSVPTVSRLRHARLRPHPTRDAIGVQRDRVLDLDSCSASRLQGSETPAARDDLGDWLGLAPRLPVQSRAGQGSHVGFVLEPRVLPVPNSSVRVAGACRRRPRQLGRAA